MTQKSFEEIRDLVDNAITAVYDERLRNLDDRRFYAVAGEQWSARMKKRFANKPMLEINKINKAVISIFTEFRNNRITVTFTPKDESLPATIKDTLSGLYRACESTTLAQEAYNNAFESAVAGGFGAWRLRNIPDPDCEEGEEQQIIQIEPIYDAETRVFFDPSAQRADKTDAEFCVVTNLVSKKAYEKEYGSFADFDKGLTGGYWLNEDSALVAEYYERRLVTDTLLVYKDLMGVETCYTDEELTQERKQYLNSTGSKYSHKVKRQRYAIYKTLLSGSSILEEETEIAGSYLPIIPVYGKRTIVDGVEICSGHVRTGRDVQVLLNLQISKVADLASLSPIRKPIFTPEQMAGHQDMWSDESIKDYPYMLINPVMDAQGNPQPVAAVGYTEPPQLPPAIVALLQTSDTSLRELLGDSQQKEKLVSNVSAEAISLVQDTIDGLSFIYLSNMAQAVRHSATVWLSKAKTVYVEEGRVLHGIDKDEMDFRITLGSPVSEDGITKNNDFTKAKFDITTSIGAPTSSKRQKTVKNLVTMLTAIQDPQIKAVLGSFALMNMDGEGVSDINRFFRKKLVKEGVIEPNEAEQAELQKEAEAAKNQPPSASDEYLLAAAQQAHGEANKALTQSRLNEARTASESMKAIELANNVEAEKVRRAIEILLSLQGLQGLPRPPVEKSSLAVNSGNNPGSIQDAPPPVTGDSNGIANQ